MKLFTKADGLPSDTVLCIDQDNEGNFWLGTRQGVSKFNGITFTNFDFFYRLPNRRVWAILCCKDGFVWAGIEEGGLALFDGKNWKHIKVASDRSSKINFFNGVLYQDSKGNIWGCGAPDKSSAENLFKYNQNKFEQANIWHAKDLCEDLNNNIYAINWFGSHLYKMSPGNSNFEIVNQDLYKTHALIVNKENDLWIATTTSLLLSTDGGNQFHEFKFSSRLTDEKNNCWDLLIDENNNVWIALDRCLVCYNGSSFCYYNEKTGLPAGGYYYIFQDNQKKYWLCSGGGLAQFDSISATPIISDSKPEITIESIYNHYFIDHNNQPQLIKSSLLDTINSGWISFEISPSLTEESRDVPIYSVELERKNKTGKILSRHQPQQQDNYFEFNNLPVGAYTLRVHATNLETGLTNTLVKDFHIKENKKSPETEIRIDRANKSHIYTKFVNIRAIANTPDCLFSYKIDDNEWSIFTSQNRFKFSGFQTGTHTISIVAKNEAGIDQTPANYTFNYYRIPELPLVQFTFPIPEKVETDSIRFMFDVKPDEIVNITGISFDSIRYSYRLIPIDSNWKEISNTKQLVYKHLKNGPYLFQIIAVDNRGRESISITEKFFTVAVIPFYQRIWFILAVCIGIISPVLFLMTRAFIKGKIYKERYNPYVVGEAVEEEDMFFGRQAFLTDILESLKRNSICLIGERRIGKTTILMHVDKKLEKPFFSFFCDLESVKPDLFFSRIMQALVNKLKSIWDIGHLNLVFVTKKRNEYDDLDFENDVESIFQFLKEQFQQEPTIIMCLDEIDATLDFPQEFHQSLRNIFQTYQGKVRMIAAGVAFQKGGWALPTSPWFNFFEYKDVLPIEKKQAEQLIVKPVKGFYSYQKQAIDFILSKTEGRPFYIQMICKKAIINILDENRRKVKLHDIQNIYNTLIGFDFNLFFEPFWESLSPDSQNKIIKFINEKSVRITKTMENELLKNTYNHSHKVIVIRGNRLKLSSIFLDWLKQQNISKV